MSTLRNIAEELDLSVSLVSKVLNGRLGTTGASAQTVTLIRDAARRLNYRKNFSAESLATGRQRAIGVFMHRHGHPSSAIAEATIIGAAERAGAAGQRLVLRFFKSSPEFFAACTDVNLSALDGLIVAGVLHADVVTQLAKLREEGVPVVTVHKRQVTEMVPNVGCDMVRLGELGTEHLISQGCRRIAHILSDGERYEGYLLALKKAGLAALPELIYDARKTFDFGAEAAKHWMERGIEFDGLSAPSDFQCATAMGAMMAAGKRIPEDVKTVGADNSPFCEFFSVAISSVSQEDERRGCMAVEMLMSMIEGKEAKSCMVEPKLFGRRSSGVAWERKPGED